MFNKKFTVFMSTALAALIMAGCGNNNKPHNQASKASMQNQSTSEKLTNHQLWYLNGKINNRYSHAGNDTFHFQRNHQVKVYSTHYMYHNIKQAKRAHGLFKQGTLHYQVKEQAQPIIKMQGKLAGIPMKQTITLKQQVTGKHQPGNVMVHGFHVIRNLDGDQTKQVLVTPN